MQCFDEWFTQHLTGRIDDQINAPEVICRFHNIVNINRPGFNTDGIGFIDIPCLVVRQATPFHVIGIVGQFDLHFMIDTAFCPACFFRPQNIQQGFRLITFFIDPIRSLRVLRDIPGLSRQECFGNLALCTVVAYRSFGYTPFFCDLSNRYIFHTRHLRVILSIDIIPHYRQEIKNLFALILFVFAVIGNAIIFRPHCRTVWLCIRER